MPSLRRLAVQLLVRPLAGLLGCALWGLLAAAVAAALGATLAAVAAAFPALGSRAPKPAALLFLALAAAAAAALLVRDRRAARRRPSTAHGSAQWGDPRPLLQSQGLIVGQVRQGLLRFHGEGHLLTVAPTGTGKTLGTAVPNLLDYPGSVLVTDIKGELFAVTARHRRDVLGHAVAVLDPFGLVGGRDSINPLDLVDPAADDAYDRARLIASLLVVPEAHLREPFWEDEAASLIAGLVLYVAATAPPAARHLGTVRHYLTLSEHDLDGLLDAMLSTELCHGLVRRAASRIRQKDPRLLAGVLASTNRHTEFLDSVQILRTVTTSTFRLEDLKHWRLSVYLVLPPHHLRTHGRWLRLLVASALRLLIATPAVPTHRVLFLLDEFGALGRMQVVEEAIAYARGYGVSIWMLIQDLARLKEIYRDSWETLLAQTRVKQAFGVADEFTADHFSRLTGQATVRVESHNRSRGRSSSSGAWLPHQQSGTSDHESETGRRLLLPDEIRRLPPDQQLLFLAGERPLLTRRVNYLAHRDLARRADPNPMYSTPTPPR